MRALVRHAVGRFHLKLRMAASKELRTAQYRRLYSIVQAQTCRWMQSPPSLCCKFLWTKIWKHALSTDLAQTTMFRHQYIRPLPANTEKQHNNGKPVLNWPHLIIKAIRATCRQFRSVYFACTASSHSPDAKYCNRWM